MQTISEAFAAWSDIQARLPGADDATFNHLAAEQARIEQAAVHLPVTSAQDAFRLLAMTCDEDSDTTFAAEALFRRAREEVSTTAPLRSVRRGTRADTAHGGLGMGRHGSPSPSRSARLPT